MKNRNAAKHPTAQDRYIGDRIKEARIAQGMHLKDLGALIGVSYQQMQKYESGKNRINGARIELLISALNRPFSYFYPGATDVRAAADPELTSVLTSKQGQRAVRAFSRLKQPSDQKLAIEVIERLAKEQANG
jgi:transcriptional regulator with XRE-family HTH domain